MVRQGQLHALLQRGLRQLLDACWRSRNSHVVSRRADQARHTRLRLAPAFEHLRVSAFHMARETGLVHQWAGLHVGTQPRAQAGQARQVTRQRNGLLHIGRLRFGHPLGPTDALQNRTAESAHTGTTGQRHVGNTHVQHLEQRRARVVRKTIQPNIQRAQHVPRRAVAADHQARRINSVGDELVLQRFLCRRAFEVPAVDHQARVFHPLQYFSPNPHRPVVDAYRPGERSKRDATVFQRGQVAHRAHTRPGSVHQCWHWQAPRRFCEQAITAGRSAPGVSEVVVDRTQTGGGTKVQPVQRYRSRFARKHPQTVAARMACDIHQYVDTVSPDALCQCIV